MACQNVPVYDIIATLWLLHVVDVSCMALIRDVIVLLAAGSHSRRATAEAGDALCEGRVPGSAGELHDLRRRQATAARHQIHTSAVRLLQPSAAAAAASAGTSAGTSAASAVTGCRCHTTHAVSLPSEATSPPRPAAAAARARRRQTEQR